MVCDPFVVETHPPPMDIGSYSEMTIALPAPKNLPRTVLIASAGC